MSDPVRDFLLDANGFLAVVNGDFAVVSGKAAAIQGLQVRQKMIQGECMLDNSIGVPWFTQILTKNADPVVVKEILQQEAESVPDITSVVMGDVALDDSRGGSVTETVTTVYDANRDPTDVNFEAPTP